METTDSITQIHELIEENIPDCSEAIKVIEEEFRKCPHPPSFIYKLSQSILKVKSILTERKMSHPGNYLMELLGK